MVLERAISIRDAIRNPFQMFLASAFISVICLAISILVFREAIGTFTTFWITFTMIPFTINLFQYKEAKEEEVLKGKVKPNIFKRHKEIILVYSAFFLGIVLSFSLLFTILPTEISEKIFKEQVETIKLIRGFIPFRDKFQVIVMNNLGVLVLCFLLSVLFGAGAIFILTWNATILAAAIGMVAKSLGGIKALPFGILVFFPHGSLEILAYFIGGIAGGIISAAISRRRSEMFFQIVIDSFNFLGMACILIIVAAMIEVVGLII